MSASRLRDVDENGVYLEDFPGCCGIYVFMEFGNYGEEKTFSVKSVEKKIKEQLGRQIGLYIVTLNQLQKPVYAGMMKRLGFKEIVTDFYSNMHGNTITMYGYLVHGENMKADVFAKKTENSIFQKVKY